MKAANMPKTPKRPRDHEPMGKTHGSTCEIELHAAVAILGFDNPNVKVAPLSRGKLVNWREIYGARIRLR